MEQEMWPVLVSCYLGSVAKTLEKNEEYIDGAIALVKRHQQEDPANMVAQLMMNLLLSAKELIKAHKAMMLCGKNMAGGSFIDGPQGSVQ
jgi:hypothetical protein